MSQRHCGNCKRKECLRTKVMCKAMERYLKRTVEGSQKELLWQGQDLSQAIENIDVTSINGYI